MPLLSTLGAAVPPQGPAFDIVLLLHVACVVVGLGTVVVSAVQAGRLLQVPAPAALPESLRTYYRPGTNWAGKSLVGVPVFGFVLLAQSGGAYRLGDSWVLIGLALWIVAVGAAEGMLWPAEGRLAEAVSSVSDEEPVPWRIDCVRARRTAWGVVGVLVVASVIMTWRP